jgi:hypothetical protein
MSVAGVVAGVGLLVVVAHVHGTRPKGDGFFTSVLTTLSEPAVAAAASLAALTLIAWCVRRLRFEWLAWLPGPLVVRTFVAPEGTLSADVERLTTTFRDRLGISHLQSSAAVPAAAEQNDFLDVLGRGAGGGGGMLGMIATFLRAGLPNHAYEVNGALVRRDAQLSCGVTVQVVRLPGKGAGGHTVWERSWETAIREAADHATAAILPRTRVCRSPWSAWRRYYMPPDLLRAYEEAADCEESRRYDEALGYYYEALDQDPMNYGLRLQIGYLQEKLGLPLNALDTYQGILTVAEPPTPEAAEDIRFAYRPRAQRERDHTVLVTRYRRAVLLGGDRLAHQWLKDEQRRNKRDEERAELRDRLADMLEKLFEAAVQSDDVIGQVEPIYREGRAQIPGVTNWTLALRETPIDMTKVASEELRQLLLLGSLYAFGEVIGEIHRLDEGPARWGRQPLTRQAVQISRLIVRERLRARLVGVPGVGYADKIDAQLREIEGEGRFRHWQDHYNAACVYSLPLIPPEDLQEGEDAPQPAEASKLADWAIERLARASARADSAFIASRRDWLLTEDPDLSGLRARREFKAFEAAYFPSATRAPQRPKEAHRWEVSRYTLRLLDTTTRRWEEVWRGRAAQPDGTDAEQLARWCAEDLTARALVRAVAFHYRDWHTRNELLTRMRAWSVENGFEPLNVSLPRFQADGDWVGDPDQVELATGRQIEANKSCLRALAGALEAEPELPLVQSRAGVPTMSKWDVARVCATRAELWKQARETVTCDGPSAPT